jgi:N-acetylglucosaminyl-diphospho-decaprenol L-rhamnosyltransferase
VLLQPGETTIDSVGVTTDATLAGFPRLQGLPASRAGDATPVLSGPEGTTAAYRRLAWQQVGGMDEAISAYMEIMDLAWRLALAGWATACAPEAVGVHLGSATFGKRSPSQRRLAGFSRGYLLRRYGVLTSRHGPRTLLIECLVVIADALMMRDLAALRGRMAGWRSASGAERRQRPPAATIDGSITLARSLALRRGAASG